jgi:hypothetical protein
MRHPRGEKVKELIRDGLRKLAAEAEDGKYTYSASQLSKLIGISRPTLYKYEEYVDEVLKEISADKKFAKGTAVIEFMRGKVARLEAEKQQLKKEVDALRQHHVDIYEALHYQSANLAPLVRPTAVQESKESGRCILCKQEVDEKTLPRPRKVVKIAERRDDGKKG